MVFDKTGTITKEGMDFAGVVPVEGSKFGQQVKFNSSDPEGHENIEKVSKLSSQLRHALASCHTVSRLLSTGQFIGNAVEVSMLRTTGWDLTEACVRSPGGGAEVLEVVKKLDFDHCRMTSGVVVRSQSTNELEVYIKGSYEKIQEISAKGTVPPDYHAKTTQCAKRGYYTLAVATKSLPASLTIQALADMTRDSFEEGLSMCGLLLFRNEIKPDSAQAIRFLEKGSVRSVICTGDNGLTGVAIGKKCEIVQSEQVLLGDMESDPGDGDTTRGKQLVWRDLKSNAVTDVRATDCHLAVTQGAWRYLHDNLKELKELHHRIVVFARMKPDDKINVVKYLQSQNLVVGMAGDGGNDCGGLRAAHAGLALSDAEASMVSPFSSGRDGKSLLTVVDMLREGRACLATNVASFRFYMTYGFSLTTARTFLALRGSLNMGEYVWLTSDLVFAILMAAFLIRSKPTDELADYRPTSTLLGPATLSGIAFPVVTGLLGVGVAYMLLWNEPWYVYMNPMKDINLPGEKWMLQGDNYDSPVAALFFFCALCNSNFVNTYGGVFRRNIIHNWGMMLCFAIGMSGISYLCLAPRNQVGCMYRVQCDTTQSLAAKDLGGGIFQKFSQLGGAGLVGGCFLGPQLKEWQPKLEGWCAKEENTCAGLVAGKYPKEHPHGFWLPDTNKEHPDESCKPPEPMDQTAQFGCNGPNNCWSPSFQMQLFGCLAVYVLLNHLFVVCVLNGPVAAALRTTQKFRDFRKRSVIKMSREELWADPETSDDEIDDTGIVTSHM